MQAKKLIDLSAYLFAELAYHKKRADECFQLFNTLGGPAPTFGEGMSDKSVKIMVRRHHQQMLAYHRMCAAETEQLLNTLENRVQLDSEKI